MEVKNIENKKAAALRTTEGEVTLNSPFYKGTVVSFIQKKGYGYIRPVWTEDRRGNLRYRLARVVKGKCFLQAERVVLFQIEQDRDGLWEAVNVIDPKYVPSVSGTEERPSTLPSDSALQAQRETFTSCKREHENSHKIEVLNKMRVDAEKQDEEIINKILLAIGFSSDDLNESQEPETVVVSDTRKYLSEQLGFKSVQCLERAIKRGSSIKDIGGK
jgi:cold shock CspA family protein